MYEAPIKLIKQQMETEIEGMVLRAVQRVGVDVNKEELMRALEYDRGQYTKGYRDGKAEIFGDEDFGAVLICAVRYSLGRMTYMPKLVMDYIRPLLPHLSRKTLFVMEKDIRTAGNYGSESIDKPEWMRFLAEVQKALENRKETDDGQI